MVDQPAHNARNRKRVAFVSGVTLVLHGKEYYYADTKDISMGGVFICTDSPLPVGETGQMILSLECGEMKTQVKAAFRVVRHQSGDDPACPCGMAVIFTDIEPDSSITLFNIVRYQDPGDDGAS